MSKPLAGEQVRAVCEALGLDAARGVRAAAVAERLFTHTAHLHGLTKPTRPLVELAAALRATLPHVGAEGAWRDRVRAALGQLVPHPAGSQTEAVVQALELGAPGPSGVGAAEPDAGRGGAGVAARRVAAIAELADGLTAGGTREATLAAALDDGEALELLVSGDGSMRQTLRGIGGGLAAWNAAMLRPIRTVAVYEGRTPPASALPPDATAAEVARRVLQTQWETFASRVDGVQHSEDIEYVHEARVALRRLRAALKVFRRALDGLVPALREELKQLADALGRVRDSDVFLVFFRGYAAQAPREHWPYLRGLLRAERRRRRRHFRALLDLLESESFAAFQAKYDPILTGRAPEGGLACLPGAGDTPLRGRAPRVLLRRLRVVTKAGRGLATASAERQHALRIQCKRLRYTAEFLAALYPRGLGPIIAPMQGMQDTLGDVHDADVYRARLAGYHARRRAAGDEALASQALAAVLAFLEQRRRDALAGAVATWKAFAKDNAPRKAAKDVP